MIVRQFLLSVDKATYDGVIRNDKGKKVEISTDDEVSVWEQELSHLDDSMQFLREQEALAKHPHPFIFKVRHIFVVNNEVIRIVTNVAPPMTLAIITERPSTAWTPSVKSKFVFALAVGTAHLHSLGFVHGNLEPRNIFLKDKPEPVISPLGIELHWNPDIDICSPPPHFRAPEVLIDERYYFTSDVYSFGMTLYSMFAPRGANTVEIYVGWGLSSRRVERHPTIPAFYWELIEKCWQSNPDERPTFLTILNDLRHCHSYVFDEANMADVLVYEATLESTMSLFVATASIRQWRPLAMLIPSRQILKKEAISNSQLFIRFANRAEPFLLLPEDTPLSVGATSRDVLLVLGRDQWPVVVTPARLVRWLLDDNDFEKIEQIGDPGAVGPVCCCRNKRTGLEFPSKAILSDRTDPEKSFREAVVHSCVVHPTITTFAGLLLSKKDLHATMYTEYYPSDSITSYLRSHPDVSNTTQMIWIYGIVFGMALLHSRRIMHRDLKLPNVLLDANLHPKICDFGLSKDFAGMNSLSQTGEKGRLAFMAPEILEGNDFSWSVDVFAFGMTVWMIVTGQRRFAHKRNEFQIGMEIMSGKRPPLPAELPQTCCNLITECWTQEPRDRPTFPRIVSCFQSGGLPLETVDESAFNNYKRRLGRVPVISERK